ncbi:MAG: hypothetical protein GTO02_17045 [Candidatus Dadabacteria bacterium]|nr:hypothetical protein [Candidatus Dadabacteria bacterium]NIQ16033.1 hypothetical protein [Candidatus Dadabacteria bacterium]
MKLSINNLDKTHELIRLLKIFNKNEINTISLKGPALSKTLYNDITLRSFSDFDLMINIKYL